MALLRTQPGLPDTTSGVHGFRVCVPRTEGDEVRMLSVTTSPNTLVTMMVVGRSSVCAVQRVTGFRGFKDLGQSTMPLSVLHSGPVADADTSLLCVCACGPGHWEPGR